MFLKKILDMRHTLAFRLTMWYGLIFVGSSLLIFILFYFTLHSLIQKRVDRELESELMEFSSLFSLNKDISIIKSEINIEAISEGVDKVFFRIIALDGSTIISTDGSAWTGVKINKYAIKSIQKGKAKVFETVKRQDKGDRIRILYGRIAPGKIIQIGRSLAEDYVFLGILRDIFGFSVVFIFMFSVILGWFMSKRVLSGLDEITRTAINISKGSLDDRAKLKVRDSEIKDLVATFNNMLDKINSLINGMREMTDNIAHDLKSPISRIRCMTELTFNSEPTIDDYRNLAADIIEECDGLIDMINTMLDISEIEAGAVGLNKENIDIKDLLMEAFELFYPVAQNKGLNMKLKVNNHFFTVGDKRKLQRMISNLIDNAIKFTPSGGSISIEGQKDKNSCIISIRDTGIGISREDIKRIFERFFKCERSRTRSGSGLGLSLARAIARAHGGDITVESRPCAGSTFRIALPL